MQRINEVSVLAALSRHIGAGNGVSARQLVAEILGPMFILPCDERRLRRVVEELRRAGEHVCATTEHGYFMAATAAELDQTCLFLYDRAMTTLCQIAAMKRVSAPDLRGQLKLPT